jgi:hypothetical protein
VIGRMRDHVARLIGYHEIVYQPVERIRQSKCFPWSRGEKPVVQFPPVWSEITYAVALHELGHALGRQANHVDEIVREQDAWDWARTHAITWTPKMERLAAACMRRNTVRWEAGMKVLEAMHEQADRAVNFDDQ